MKFNAMKRLAHIVVLMLLLGACAKEMEEQGEYSDNRITLNIESGCTKTILDDSTLKIAWSAGDQLLLWSKGTPYSTKLTAESAGSKSLFSGTQGQLDISKELFAIYPASSVQMQSSGYSGVTIQNHALQSGLLSDFGRYNVSYTGALTKSGSDAHLSLSYADAPANLLPIIKFRIKEGIDVRSITVAGLDNSDRSTHIAGNINLTPDPLSVSVSGGDEITIYRDGDIINGDVYVFCSPCAATKLKFVFTNSEDKISEYTNFLQNPLEGGVLSDFGTISSLAFKEAGLYVVRGGEKWAKLTQKRDIVAGSALDFSSFAIDAPAGKYGPLKAVGNHFEFTNRTGVEQIFYGANLTSSACAPPKESAPALAQRLARIGYNTVRLHHYDALWAANENDEAGDSYRDRMDYFVNELIKKGLYITFDLHSARKVTYADLGFSGTGEMDGNVFKILMLASAALSGDSKAASSGYLNVYQNWCNFTDSVLDHTNPYTGKKYSAEPAVIMVTVLNEPSYRKAWENRVYDYALVQYAWSKCHGSGATPPSSVSIGSTMWNTFVQWVQSNGYAGMVAYCNAKNCKALLSVAYDSCCYIDGASGLSSLDVHDSHAYIDHPSGDLPARTIDGENPLLNLPPYVNTSSTNWINIFNRRSGVPHTLTEWNHCTPNPLRALGAICGSAFLRERGWDGIWRFAYAQGASNYNSENTPNFFDVSKDEVMKASEAGVISFFLRGDVTAPSSQISFTETEFSAITNKSVALYKQGMGTKTAGLLTATTSLYPATLLVTSLDGANLSDSGRMLLVNMTDCAGNNSTFTDETKKVTVAYGTGQYIRISRSDIALSLSSPASYKVYELDADGSRVSEIPATVNNNQLCFSISVRGTDGKAHIYYEITK